MAKSLLRNVFNRMIEGTERRAARHQNSALLRLSDDTLKALGKDRDELHRGVRSHWDM